MLELTGASYRYAGFAREVLHDVDLRLDDGEIVGLVGPNEAGKSTLCLVASGLAPASIGGTLRGTLTLDGVATAGMATYQLADRIAARDAPATRDPRRADRPARSVRDAARRRRPPGPGGRRDVAPHRRAQ